MKERSGNVLGENIRKLRNQNKETQSELGAAIGYGATTVANYESGYRQPDIQTMQRIAAHYEKPIDELLRLDSGETGEG